MLRLSSGPKKTGTIPMFIKNYSFIQSFFLETLGNP